MQYFVISQLYYIITFTLFFNTPTYLLINNLGQSIQLLLFMLLLSFHSLSSFLLLYKKLFFILLFDFFQFKKSKYQFQMKKIFFITSLLLDLYKQFPVIFLYQLFSYLLTTFFSYSYILSHTQEQITFHKIQPKHFVYLFYFISNTCTFFYKISQFLLQNFQILNKQTPFDFIPLKQLKYHLSILHFIQKKNLIKNMQLLYLK
ncbi:transmembrane protein, putative (macronuclear) [Tetrahymena thermophila SB210]|uniref:Transmembrane protein, putative n=1 Tax=Tetrahymena thermophila (strain SB210) TaxID=312017 RepID=W7XB63_TETTS|nr:transmembrane protein, putative [Tetrahymena thermophila SB210]EWS74572.1 transmembrane protein, putative [Tetrahymena thermophila SB210]|eukprot:XP_012652873.1 transmembrane protein, putative [Tetrahymena thermophila SB210]